MGEYMNKYKCVLPLRQLRQMVAFFLIAVMLLSAVFVMAYADHNCDGADCKICLQVQTCLNSFRLLLSGIAVFSVAFLLLLLLAVLAECAGAGALSTPITLKVKLLN